jgi:hypothetical protein
MLRASRQRTFLLLAALVVVTGLWFFSGPSLPRATLHDGTKFRVYAIAFTPHPSHSYEHNLHASRLYWRIYERLPTAVRARIPVPALGIGGSASDHSMLSIWWGYIPKGSQQPEIAEAGDALLTLDSGEVINLGWPSPYDDESSPEGPGYRQIIVVPVPTNSRTLTFEFPTEGKTIRFTISNPAWSDR